MHNRITSVIVVSLAIAGCSRDTAVMDKGATPGLATPDMVMQPDLLQNPDMAIKTCLKLGKPVQVEVGKGNYDGTTVVSAFNPMLNASSNLVVYIDDNKCWKFIPYRSDGTEFACPACRNACTQNAYGMSAIIATQAGGYLVDFGPTNLPGETLFETDYLGQVTASQPGHAEAFTTTPTGEYAFTFASQEYSLYKIVAAEKVFLRSFKTSGKESVSPMNSGEGLAMIDGTAAIGTVRLNHISNATELVVLLDDGVSSLREAVVAHVDWPCNNSNACVPLPFSIYGVETLGKNYFAVEWIVNGIGNLHMTFIDLTGTVIHDYTFGSPPYYRVVHLLGGGWAMLTSTAPDYSILRLNLIGEFDPAKGTGGDIIDSFDIMNGNGYGTIAANDVGVVVGWSDRQENVYADFFGCN